MRRGLRASIFFCRRGGAIAAYVAGLVRGVEKACRDCTTEGSKLLQEKLSFWQTWQIIWNRTRWQRDFQMQMEMKLRQTVEPQVEQVVQMLETDLRGLWPQLNDMLQTLLEKELRNQVPRTIPDFARQRRELLQSAYPPWWSGSQGSRSKKSFDSSSEKRPPGSGSRGLAAAGGVITIIAALSSAAVADVTGVLALSAAVAGTVVAVSQRKKILKAYETQMETKCGELVQAIEQQMARAIDLFYAEVATAFHPLQAFCMAKRRQFEPLLQRTEELRRTFDALTSRIN